MVIRGGQHAAQTRNSPLVPTVGRSVLPRRNRVSVVIALAAFTILAGLLVAPGILPVAALQMLVVIVLVSGVLVMYLGTLSLERELREARLRAIDATDLERKRIERDLHDSAQQRLVSVRIHLSLLERNGIGPADRARLDQLGSDLDAALADIRSVTREGFPDRLLRNGVVPSLRSVVGHAAIPVTLETRGFERYPNPIERCVYFCSVEALQNAVKHAGRNAVARIRLTGESNRVIFEVEDSGIGFDPNRVTPGSGLVNLADRLAVVNGRLTIDSRPGMGTRIRGEIPIA
jgi:signal transduction histidine kinase